MNPLFAASLFLALSASLLLGVSGCATEQVPPLTTPSGRPEVTIHAPIERVRSQVLTTEVGGGSTLVKQTENSLVFSAVAGGLANTLLYGTQFSGSPYTRVTYTLVPEGGAVRVFIAAEIVSNYGTAFEQSTAVATPAANRDFEHLLERIKSQCEARH